MVKTHAGCRKLLAAVRRSILELRIEQGLPQGTAIYKNVVRGRLSGVSLYAKKISLKY